MTTTIILVSDTHYTTESFKNVMISRLLQELTNGGINYIVTAGDLTDNGYDGVETCTCLNKYFPCFFSLNNCVVGGSTVNQLQNFILNYADKIDTIIGKDHNFLITGNHDEYNGATRYPVLKYVAEREYPVARDLCYEDLFYERTLSENLVLLCCGKFATKKVCDWLRERLVIIQREQKKCIISQHYCLTGEFSPDVSEEWMTTAQRTYLYNTIEPFLNVILGIHVGHRHVTALYETTTTNGSKFLEIYGAGILVNDGIAVDTLNSFINGIHVTYNNSVPETSVNDTYHYMIANWNPLQNLFNLKIS